jgi:hypothetical protein
MKVWSSRGIISYDTSTYQTLPQLTKNEEEPMPLTPMRREGSSPGGYQLEEQPWLSRIGRGHLSGSDIWQCLPAASHLAD